MPQLTRPDHFPRARSLSTCFAGPLMGHNITASRGQESTTPPSQRNELPVTRLRPLFVLLLGLMLVGSAASSASAAPSSQDTTWMAAAHQSNLAEIAAGKAAEKSASTSAVRDLAAMFVAMHSTLDATLSASASTLGVTLPTAPTAAQQSSLAAVTAQSGAAFDTAWIAQQTMGHEAAVAATKTEIAQGSDARVTALARAALPVIQGHLTSLLRLAGTPVGVDAGTGGQAATGTSPALPLGLLFGGLVLLGAAAVRTRRRTL